MHSRPLWCTLRWIVTWFPTHVRLDYSFSSETPRNDWAAEPASRALMRSSLKTGSHRLIGRSCRRSSSIRHSCPTSVLSHLFPCHIIDFQPQQDSANFDFSHQLDEFMLAEKPLTAHKRKANPEKMKPEMRQLETDFTVYDFERSGRRSYYPLNEPLIAQHSHDGRLRPTFTSSSHTNTNTYVQSNTATSHTRSSTSHSERPRYSSQHDPR